MEEVKQTENEQMIKLIPCPKITKRELMTALMEGRRFTINKSDDPDNVIHWAQCFGDNPVRLGSKNWNWRGFKYLHEITESHWYDNIPEEGVLCWVHGALGNPGDVAQPVKSYYQDVEKPFSTVCGRWDCATPVQPKDLYQEPV